MGYSDIVFEEGVYFGFVSLVLLVEAGLAVAGVGVAVCGGVEELADAFAPDSDAGYQW
jgi:hypothetical protein